MSVGKYHETAIHKKEGRYENTDKHTMVGSTQPLALPEGFFLSEVGKNEDGMNRP